MAIKTIMQNRPKKILIIKPSSLGDIVHTLPVPATLRKSFPAAHICWLVRPEFAWLVQNHPDLDEVIIFDRKFLAKSWFHPSAFKSLFRLIVQLRRRKFDVVFDLQGLLRTALFGWLSGCKKRFGMKNARELAHVFYTHKIAQDYNCIHIVDYHQKILQAAGASAFDINFILPVTASAANRVDALLSEYKIKPCGYVVFAPSSNRLEKCWPVHNFAKLADKLTAGFNVSVIAVGTESEKAVIQELKRLAKSEIIDFAGRTTIPELTVLLKNARLVVSNDTGPGHIAAALSVALVLIFGPTNPARVAPYGRDDCIVAVDADKRGLKHTSSDPRHRIEAVTVEQVYQKASRQLESQNPARQSLKNSH